MSNLTRVEVIQRIKNRLYSSYLLLVALIIVVAMLISSCNQNTVETIPVATDFVPSEQNDYYDSLNRGPSGPLRIYWSTRSNLNPVIDQTYSGQAISKLVYGSLLTNKEDGSLTYDLAERVIWTEDGLNLFIMLREDQFFHDGNELKAVDAAAALAYLWSQNGGPEFRAENFSSNGQEDDDSLDNSNDETDDSADQPEQDSQSDDDETIDDDEDDATEVINKYPEAKTKEELFALLQEIKVLDDYSFKCVFSAPAQEFTALLDFPIITADSWLSEDPLDIFAGTGKYKIVSYEENGDLILKPLQQTDKGPDKIIVRQYYDEIEAMKALEEDELDLVLLSQNSYPLFYSRKNLDLIRFPALSSVFLTANTDGMILSSSEALLDLKKLLQSENLKLTGYTWPGELADYPLSAISFITDYSLSRISNQIGLPEPIKYTDGHNSINYDDDYIVSTTDESADATVNDNNEDGAPEDSDQRPQIRMIALHDDHLLATAREIQSVIETIYRVELEILQHQEYIDALQNHDYDLALCQTNYLETEEPAWLYGPDGSVSGMENLEMNGINNYNDIRQELHRFHEIWYKPNETDRIDFTDKQRDFSRTIVKTAAYSPYIHLYLPYAAIAYGDRVKGQSDPNKYDPYKGIEELWVWSGQ